MLPVLTTVVAAAFAIAVGAQYTRKHHP